MKYLLTMSIYCLCATAMALDYTGHQLVAVLGKSVSSPEFQQYKNFWLLDSKFENPDGGIRVVINPNTLTVDTILVAGYNYAPAYTNCSSKLPYNIQLNDNVSAISQKTGVAPLHYGTNIGYDVKDYHIMVKYNNGSNINCVRFFNPNSKPYSAATVLNVTIPEGASKREIARINFDGAENTVTATNSSTAIAQPAHNVIAVRETTAPPVNEKLESTRRALENTTFNTTGTKALSTTSTATIKTVTATGSTASAPVAKTSTTTATKTGTTTTTVVKSTPTFKTSILAVFNSWRESGFYSIKNTPRSSYNVWNYKYTYATKLRIPGEQYNMLYSFPFESSQMDFVSILKEGDSFEGFEAAYKEYERKLMENFPKGEGWIGTCLPNYDKSNLSDFEIRNDRYGSVILDYCKTPKGKHILYLRFLLYS